MWRYVTPAMTTSTTDGFGRRSLADPWVLLATAGGLGLSPRAPGTVGSLGALLPLWLLTHLPWPWFALFTAGVFVIGVWASDRIERRYGGHDHSAIVIDEVVGQWLAIGLPLYLAPGFWSALDLAVAGFVLFRLFDIAKPPPVGWLDRRVSGGLGVMVDDVAAGLMAATVLLVWSRVMG